MSCADAMDKRIMPAQIIARDYPLLKKDVR
jgi:hypothetical protein